MMATNDAEFALYQKMDKEREDKRRQELQKLYPDGNYDVIVPTSQQSKSRGRRASKKVKDEEVDEIQENGEQENGDQENGEQENGEQENGEQEPTLPSLPSRLMGVSDVPLWARSQESWLPKHHQLFTMSDQVEKNNLQVGNNGVYTVVEVDNGGGDDDDESNVDGASIDGANSTNNGGGRGLSNFGNVSWGASTRKRKATTGVIYDDGLTETQFMDLVEKTEKVILSFFL